MILWRGEELGAASAPICVGRRHVRDADVEKVAHPVRVTGRLERDRRLVVCRPSADVDDDPAVRERDDRRFALPHKLGAEYVCVEAARAFDVVGDDEMRKHDPVLRCREFGHRSLLGLFS